MATLTEEKFHIVQQYVGLLETIQEAFEHIPVCFEELRYEGAMDLWEDILLAFSQIDDSHPAISEHFAENPGLLVYIERFEEVLEATELLGNVNDIVQVDQIISKKIYPVFLSWRFTIDQEIKPYYIL
ncbi:hypothetical protein J7E38_07615 [Bacillus sp. ISL-35]|uniref:hypothetical protein n=1 Tax=Bacillus sp. ISL-35 TaxID=2819122 RepID=UPI001BEBF1D4|nr:hypothetical protein [Bacillus sp. ISL-35]MBT2678869.1 hypothetical protein [Bacillus sp. ISL-35]MBT2703861.1 hypothetical protein [Chryseobacterium sp. ISL-80]